jgi:hypothetical protein
VTTLNPLPGTRILDVAGGTGDIAFRCLDRMKSTSTFFSKAPGTTLPPATLLPTPCGPHVLTTTTAGGCGVGTEPTQEPVSEHRLRSLCATSTRPCSPWARSEASLAGTQKAPVRLRYAPS